MSTSEKPPLTDEVLFKAAKATLDDQAKVLDDEVRLRLQQARRTAVRAAQAPSRTAAQPKWLVPAGGFAVMAFVVSIAFYNMQSVHDVSPVASIEDMPILTAPEDLEMYEELEFYQWLAEEHDDVG